jgi:hypothetical protein
MNYIITLLFLILSASASVVSHTDTVWFAILLLMTIYVIAKKLLTKNDLKVVGIFLLVYLLYVILRNVVVTNLSSEYLISDLIFPFKYALLSFIYCVIVREKALENIVRVMTHLTIVALVFYTLQLVGFADTIYNASESLNLPKANTIPGYTNFIIFSFTKGLHEYRDSGFVWEPGAFGCFLIVAMLFNFFLNKFTFDRKTIILMIGVLTTFSTTDYLALIILLFFVYRYRVPKINIWVIILIPTFVILFITIPFLGDKIADIYTEDIAGLDHLHEISKYNLKHNEQIPLNRFASMIYLYNNVGSNLILGLSNKYDEIIDKVYNVNISNGIFDFLAKFGLVGFIYLMFTYIKFCAAYVKKMEYVIYCVLILLIISFGEPILFLPLILLFLFLPFLTKVEDSVTNKYGIPELV